MNLRGGDNMGIFHDLLCRSKKRCTMCGCIMHSDSDSDICEVCLDELYESDPGDPPDGLRADVIIEDEIHAWPKENPYLKREDKKE